MRRTRSSLFVLFVSALVAGSHGVAHATILEPVTEDQLVERAELIFAGRVTQIETRLSDRRTREDALLPHLFVTFDIEHPDVGGLDIGQHAAG